MEKDYFKKYEELYPYCVQEHIQNMDEFIDEDEYVSHLDYCFYADFDSAQELVDALLSVGLSGLMLERENGKYILYR